MASVNYIFYGKFKWTKISEKHYDEKFKRYTLDFYPDAKSMTLFRKSGIQLEVREDKDGEGDYVKFSRPRGPKPIGKKIIEFGPPEIVMPEGHEPDEAIGNGSEGSVTVCVYDTVKGKGSRLEKVVITALVPYGDTTTVDAADEVPETTGTAERAKPFADQVPF